jgi:hypothetical protein
MRYWTPAVVVAMTIVMMLSSLGVGGARTSNPLVPSHHVSQSLVSNRPSNPFALGPHYTASGLTVKGNFMPWVCQFCNWSGSESKFAKFYEQYAGNMTQLSYEMFYLGSSGTSCALGWICSSGYVNTTNDLTPFAHQNHIAAIPMLTSCNTANMEALLGSSSAQTAFIDEAIKLAGQQGYAGYNLDWEPTDASGGNGCDATDTPQDGYNLAHFLDAFTNASAAKGLVVTLDFAHWDSNIWNLPALGHTTTSILMDMNYECPGTTFTSYLSTDTKDIPLTQLGEGLDPESGCTAAQMVQLFSQLNNASVTNSEWWALNETGSSIPAALNPILWTAVHDFIYQGAYNGSTSQSYSSGAWGLNANEYPASYGGNLYLFTLGTNEKGYMHAEISGTTTINSVNITQDVSLNSAHYRIYEANLTATGTIQSSWQLPDVNTTLHLGPPGGASAVTSLFFELATAPGGAIGGHVNGGAGTYAYFDVQINGGVSTLSSVTLSPTSPTVTTASSTPFTATPKCTATCPSGTTYAWALTSTALGTISPTSGATTTFTAGTTAGTVGLYVNATLNGVTMGTSTIITVSTLPVSLNSVAVAPTSPSVVTSSATPFTATPTCSATCPNNITYAWALTGTTLGTISPATSYTTTFTAGTMAGTVGLYVNATLGKHAVGTYTVITVMIVTIESVAIYPPSPTVAAGGIQAFTATPACSSTCPTSGITCAWSLTSTVLGSINPATGASTTFTAGTNGGTVGLYVNATLAGVTVMTLTIITVTTTPVNILTSVSVSPTSPIVSATYTQVLTVSVSCSMSACPTPLVTYAWALTSTALGSISIASTVSTVFTAGTNAGTVGIFVNATLNGTTLMTYTVITVSAQINFLTSVTATPVSIDIDSGGTQIFTATPYCTSTCPSTGISYAWTLTSTALGTISSTTGSATIYTAGTSAVSGRIFVNATLAGVTKGSSALITVAVTPPVSLASVSVSPVASTVAADGIQVFTATPTCSATCPASGITYIWSLTSTLGSISADTGVTTIFTAGANAGTVGLYVNATLSATTKEVSAIITATGTSPPVLTGVSLTPIKVNLSTGGSQLFEAVATCTGGTCPSTVTYAWSLNNSLGNLSSSTYASTTFTAGSTAGHVTIAVSATLNGKTVYSSAPIIISSTQNVGTGGLFPGGFLWLLMAVGAVAVVVVIAVVLSRKKGTNEVAPPPDWPQPQVLQPPEYPVDGTSAPSLYPPEQPVFPPPAP